MELSEMPNWMNYEYYDFFKEESLVKKEYERFALLLTIDRIDFSKLETDDIRDIVNKYSQS